MGAGRDKSRDGLKRRVRSFLLQNFEPFWRLVEAVPFVARIVNRYLINSAVQVTRNRPHPLSTVADYTSWLSLTDRSYFARHLPPVAADPALPAASDVVGLFRRKPGAARECRKSTLLFPVFAQYLTDGFLRTDMADRLRTTSNHEIDLSTLYGRTRPQTDVLRTRSDDRDQRGKLKSQMIDGEEYATFLFEPDGKTIRAEFLDERGNPVLDLPLGFKVGSDDGYERRIFAVGGDRVNATPQVCMINTLLLREHNRLAGELALQHPAWDDERVFQTARNIVTVMFIKIVIEEYINHISSACFRLKADPSVAWKASWNRPNWMTIEFALLYRWHPLIPDAVVWNGATIDAKRMVLDNRFLTEIGVGRAMLSVSGQNAGALGLFNTAAFLEEVERRAIEQGRDHRVARYNDFRVAVGMRPVDDFAQITTDPDRRAALKALYGSPAKLEFYVGLFADDVNLNTPMPTLIGIMVALDAFSQALTNPLLSEHVYNAATFTAWGLGEIERTPSLWSLLQRNAPAGLPEDATEDQITMTRRDWRRRWASF
jgi:prostaglandin-endoperoxide synthase 2